MADINLIFPRELIAAATVSASDVIPVDNGAVVQKATPVQIVNAGRPFATQGQAETGTDATVAMSPLTTRQAINALAPAIIEPFIDLAEAWAESPTAPDPGVPTSKSSKTWAGEAEASATAASGFAGAASSSASDAQDSADAAANSASSILGLPLVRYDAQALTGPQKDQVKTNLEAVGYAAQTLTAAQRDQVKSNIEAVSYATQTLTSAQQAQVRTNIGFFGLGISQTWQGVSRVINTIYTNTTGRPIMVFLRAANGTNDDAGLQVSSDGTNWLDTGIIPGTFAPYQSLYAVVPNGHYYRFLAASGAVINRWAELR